MCGKDESLPLRNKDLHAQNVGRYCVIYKEHCADVSETKSKYNLQHLPQPDPLKLVCQISPYSKGDVDKFDSFEKKYAWLEATIANKEADLDFHTVDDAHKLVERLRNIKPTGYISIIKKIVDRVCSDVELSGDSADYHNLAAEMARGSMYIESCRVLKKGLCYFPKDTDLLSDLIEYATKGSMFDDADEATNQLLNDIPRRLWTWRCYEFICDYYRAIGELEKADKLCDELIAGSE